MSVLETQMAFWWTCVWSAQRWKLLGGLMLEIILALSVVNVMLSALAVLQRMAIISLHRKNLGD